MRGAPWISIFRMILSRIIPADAGSTHKASGRSLPDQDHPRGCGEHTVWRRFETGRDRIIPADAGSTAPVIVFMGATPDHPRGCGEHRHYRRHHLACAGSSPRMRGAHPPCTSRRGSSRIIPADAGSTLCRTCCRDCRRDHPRGCGEHLISS